MASLRELIIDLLRILKLRSMVPLLMLTLVMFGCNGAYRIHFDSDSVKYVQVNTIRDALVIEYTVSNVYPQDVWICRGIEAYGSWDYFLELEDGVLYVKLKCFDLPILTEVPVLAVYERIGQEEDLFKSITIPRAIKLYDGSRLNDLDEINKIVLQIGFVRLSDLNLMQNPELRYNPDGELVVGHLSNVCGIEEVIEIIIDKPSGK